MDIAALGVDITVVLGAKIINMSYGYQYNPEDPNSFEYFEIFGTAIQNAYNEDVVMVASIGNTGNDLSELVDSLQMYPAFFPEVISVCAIDQNDVIREIIKQTSDDISSQNSGQDWFGKLGAGRINAYSALRVLENTPSTPSGFTKSSAGGHPRIYLNKNSEADVEKYNVKRILYNWIGLPFKWETVTSYISTSDTFYQDNSFSIGSVMIVYYSIWAIDYCGNSSSYTADVLYQDTSPLWKMAYSEIDTIIYCQLNSDGVILSYEYGPDTFFTYTNGLYLITGDNDNNQTASISFRSFLSFDIASLKMSNIIKAVLKVYQEQSFGDGVLGEYPVLLVDGDTTYCTVSHICIGDSLKPQHWTAGDEGDSLTLASHIGYISTTPEIGFRELEVTQQVIDDISNNRQYSQYRLAFPIRAD